LLEGAGPCPIRDANPRLIRANPSRGGDAKPEVFAVEIALAASHNDVEVVMHNRIRNLRIIVSLCAVATVVAVVPSAQAAPGGNTTSTNVCNEARKGHEGQYTATDQDPSTPARNQSILGVLGN
jgi:hypothetical protein